MISLFLDPGIDGRIKLKSNLYKLDGGGGEGGHRLDRSGSG